MPRPTHFEIHAEQPERAIIFYQAMFGWEFTSWAGPMPYRLIKTGEGEPGINGGVMAIPRMGWLAYVKDTEGNIFGMMDADPKVA